MKKVLVLLSLASIPFLCFAQNVMISDQFNPCEPSIMLDPGNPAIMVAGTDFVYFSFKLRQAAVVDIYLYDAMGRLAAIVLNQEKRDYGSHIVSLDLKALKLQVGAYFGKVMIDGKEMAVRQIMVD